MKVHVTATSIANEFCMTKGAKYLNRHGCFPWVTISVHMFLIFNVIIDNIPKMSAWIHF